MSGAPSDVRLVLRPEARVGAFVARPFAPYVVASLASVDAVSNVHYLTPDDLFASETTIARAFDAADAHATTGRTTSTVVRAPCASGLLASPGWLASFVAPGAGRPLAAAPDRDVVLVSLDTTAAGVRSFAERVRRSFHEAERPVSPALYTVDDRGAVVPLASADDSRATREVELGHALLAATAYAEQKTRLDATAKSSAPFVAEHLLIERRDDGRAVTIATWGEQTPTLLPRVDVVVLAGGAWRFAVRWSVLEARVGPSCWRLRADLRPARVETTMWPSDVDLAALFDARDPLIDGSPPGVADAAHFAG